MAGSSLPKLILHGGAGRMEGNVDVSDKTDRDAEQRETKARLEDFHETLTEIAGETFRVLLDSGARAAVLHGLARLEDHPLFNAGTGSRIQSDGQVRMSAALMDGPANVFSGVVNVEAIRHPSELAALLSAEENTVLAGSQATAFAREKGFAVHDPITPGRRAEYEKLVLGKSGTVGVVALDAAGNIFAGTSTGGVGGETPGRVSDSATVAGTYASPAAGVSCTGNGEQIVNQAAAAKVVTRIGDGLSLKEAVRRTIAEADALGYNFGLIALDREGNLKVGQTGRVNVFFASHDGEAIRTFLELLDGGQ